MPQTTISIDWTGGQNISSWVASMETRVKDVVLPRFQELVNQELMEITDQINQNLRQGKGLGGTSFAPYSPATIAIRRSQGRPVVGQKPLSTMAGSVVFTRLPGAVKTTGLIGGTLQATHPWSSVHNTGRPRVRVFGNSGSGRLPQRKFFPTLPAEGNRLLPSQTISALWAEAWKALNTAQGSPTTATTSP